MAWDAESKIWNTSDGYAKIPSLFNAAHDKSFGMRDPMHAMFTLMDRAESLALAGAAESPGRNLFKRFLL